eukprot:TRINITY_DN11161_c0_g1_i1.p1 TRINITY_DN11161_c0_g1~~TRINITY_DN11161_c0_g1_i1.p1  ORF type:complete len:188 (+),score=16.76 TRINITY_DN11161_c0_g1_i1:145-708(+)
MSARPRPSRRPSLSPSRPAVTPNPKPSAPVPRPSCRPARPWPPQGHYVPSSDTVIPAVGTSRGPSSASPNKAENVAQDPREDAEDDRPRLDRHRGAQRDMRPAWMTKGCGVNKEIFGETRGDLVKPGLTKADLEALEKKVRSDSPDPLGDFFHDRSKRGGGSGPGRSRSRGRREPLLDQGELYATLP